MKNSKGSTFLTILIIVLGALLIIAIALAIYFNSKNKKSSEEKTTTPSETFQNLETPQEIVENFMHYSIGTLPSATLNFDAARLYLSDDLKLKYSFDNTFAADFYGYQEGPDFVEITAENINGNYASVTANAFWREMGLGWAFNLEKTNNQWLIVEFRNDAQ